MEFCDETMLKLLEFCDTIYTEVKKYESFKKKNRSIFNRLEK